jgi:AraC-like DNA-binding protein
MARVTLDWIELAAALGSLQGLLLTVVLLAQRNNRTANRLLAALMASFTVYLASAVYYATGLIQAWPHFFGFSFFGPWVFGPLVYLYSVAASDRSWRFERHQWLHFALPAAIFVVESPYFFTSGAAKIAFYDQLMSGNVPARITLVEPTKYISGIGYSIATVLYLRGHRRRIQENYSNVARVNLNWLLWLAGAAAIIWILATTLKVGDFGQRLREGHITLAMALLVYAIGYKGLRQPEVFRYQTSEFAIPVRTPAAPVEQLPPSRYERSGLSDNEAKELEASLLALMDRESPWKDSDLTLPQLAERLGTTPHKLSEVLNTQVGQTFYDFVNGYRVREVQRRIKGGEARQLKMLALAMDAGFASKSTFNEVFKKHTSKTPSDFRQAVGG